VKNIAIVVLTISLLFAILYKKHNTKLKKIMFRQSSIHMLVRYSLPSNKELRSKRSSQSKVHIEKNVVRVVKTPDNKVYWVDNNIFYCAEIVDGEFNPETAQPINTADLSKEEIDDLLFILDNLKNG